MLAVVSFFFNLGLLSLRWNLPGFPKVDSRGGAVRCFGLLAEKGFVVEYLISEQGFPITAYPGGMLAEADREILTQSISQAEGNQAKAARWLGLSRFTLREKLKQLGLHPDSTEASPES